MIPLIRNVQKRGIHRDGKQISVCQGLGTGGWEVTANEYGVTFLGDEYFMKDGNGCTQYTKNH